MPKSPGWTCQRVSGGVKCGHSNPSRSRKCQGCGKPRPKKKQPAHMTGKRSYEEHIEINGGEFCGICGAKPDGRKLDRDHSHTDPPYPRGLLDRKCNRALTKTRYGLEITPDWLRAAADYLERAERRMG